MIANDALIKAAFSALANETNIINSARLAAAAWPNSRRGTSGPPRPSPNDVAAAGRFLIGIIKNGMNGYLIQELPGRLVTVKVEKCAK